MNIPVFIVNGFLESGKSQFVLETIKDPDFTQGAKTLLIVCEEGEVEYDEKELKKKEISIVTVDEEDRLNETFLSELDSKYKPERVLIEFNGMWNFEEFLEKDLIESWELAQIITMIDASTWNNYINNFKAIMVGQFRFSDTIIVNRCDDTTDKIGIRRIIKPVNKKAQIIYETVDGLTTDAGEDVMPFDINAPVIELEDDDYGLWYMNASEHPEKYAGKTIRFKGFVYKADRLPKGYIVPGRFAMTCCANDATFIGFLCKTCEHGFLTYDHLKSRMWVMVTAKMEIRHVREYNGNGIVLYATKIEPAKEPEEKLVYFN